MALSAPRLLGLEPAYEIREPVEIVSDAVVYKGAFAAVGAANHATSGKRGYAYPYNDEDGAIFAGLVQSLIASGVHGQNTATGTATTPSAANAAELILNDTVIKSIAVTGASAAADRFKPVYLTDDGTLTLTPTDAGPEVGLVLRWISSTNCRVLIYGLATHRAMRLAGAGQTQEMYLGSYDAAAMANGNILTGRVLQGSGRITGFFAQVTRTIAGTGGTATLNLEIGGTNVGPTTPTSIVVSTAVGTLGVRIASVAIAVNNTFVDGDLLDVEAASVTTMTAGAFDLFAYVVRTGQS